MAGRARITLLWLITLFELATMGMAVNNLRPFSLKVFQVCQ